jgi:DNA-binding transcriptional ArsR family regulator
MAYGSSLNALADPTRRTIFEKLGRGPRAVGELAAGLPVSRPAVSQHLRVLKEAGLVSDEQVGTRRVYRVEPAGLRELREWVDGFWKDALASFQDAVEQESSTKRRKK